MKVSFKVKRLSGVLKMFEVEESKVVVKIGEDTVEVEELTVDTLKRLAKERGLKKFIAEQDGQELTSSDFPITDGTVVVKPYYEAK